jgi:hypothetical protein
MGLEIEKRTVAPGPPSEVIVPRVYSCRFIKGCFPSRDILVENRQFRNTPQYTAPCDITQPYSVMPFVKYLLKIVTKYRILALMGANTKYKDSLSSFLFSDPAALRELYSALEGITLPPDVPITVNTLWDVLFMERINDISFTIDDKLVILLEHQSTINPNMVFRLLMYIARIYEKILGDKNLYTTKAIPIPRAERGDRRAEQRITLWG